MGFTRFITARNNSDSGSYDGDTMAGSSCERKIIDRRHRRENNYGN